MENERRSGGCLRRGCFGCAGLLAVLAVGAAVLLSLGRQAARSQDVATRSVEEELPTPTPVPAEPDETSGAASAVRGDTPPLAVPDFTPDAGGGVAPGRVRIDLRHGEFHVEPAPAGSTLRVEAEYDQKRYELVTELDEEGDGWRYEVRFQRVADTGLVSFLAQLMGADNPRVTVFLPREVPMDLDLRFSQGGGEVDLGGLWLTDARVTFTQGGGELEFSEPLREPADSLSIEASMGGGAFRLLGNASPRTLDVVTRMGGGEVDLRGQWVRDAQISISTSMGGVDVRVPVGVITRGLPRDQTAPDGEEGADVPTLDFSYSSDMGEIQFR